MNLTVDLVVLKKGAQSLELSAEAAYHAFAKELPGLNFSNFRRDYTQAAADNHAPSSALKPPTKIDKPGDYYQSEEKDGLTRSWKTHVPPSYHGQAMPVVVVLHGRGQDGAEIEKLSGMSEKADKDPNGFIVVYPDAVKWFGKKEFAAWDAKNGVVPPFTKTDDPGFVKAVFDKTESQLNTNGDFLVAYSNGGMMAPQVMQAMEDRLPAVALVSSGIGEGSESPLPIEIHSKGRKEVAAQRASLDKSALSTNSDTTESLQSGGQHNMPQLELASTTRTIFNKTANSNEKQAVGPTSILNMHGSIDPIIPVDGVSHVPSFVNRLGLPRFYSGMETKKYWLSVEKINSDPTTTRTGNLTERSYTSSSGAEFREDIVEGGGHTWFGPGNGNHGADASVNATDIVVAFLRTHGRQSFDAPPPSRSNDQLIAEANPLMS